MTCRFNECEGGRMGTHCRAECVPRQSEALRLAEWLEGDGGGLTTLGDCAAELRRLYAERTAADGVVNDLAAKVRRLAKVEAQRDALLEAAKEAEPMLQAMLDNIRKTLPQYTKMPALDKLRAAIKAVEEQK